LSLAVGVGSSLQEAAGFWSVADEEDTVAVMDGADVGSTKACPRRVIPERGQVAEYAVEATPAESSDVLQDDELWSKNANALGDGEPEATTRPLLGA
jgi:hypothetical protein